MKCLVDSQRGVPQLSNNSKMPVTGIQPTAGSVGADTKTHAMTTHHARQKSQTPAANDSITVKKRQHKAHKKKMTPFEPAAENPREAARRAEKYRPHPATRASRYGAPASLGYPGVYAMRPAHYPSGGLSSAMGYGYGYAYGWWNQNVFLTPPAPIPSMMHPHNSPSGLAQLPGHSSYQVYPWQQMDV
jgi:hypothetical protein